MLGRGFGRHGGARMVCASVEARHRQARADGTACAAQAGVLALEYWSIDKPWWWCQRHELEEVFRISHGCARFSWPLGDAEGQTTYGRRSAPEAGDDRRAAELLYAGPINQPELGYLRT
jgi:hypothetical protein